MPILLDTYECFILDSGSWLLTSERLIFCRAEVKNEQDRFSFSRRQQPAAGSRAGSVGSPDYCPQSYKQGYGDRIAPRSQQAAALPPGGGRPRLFLGDPTGQRLY